nr:hypothetical protein [Raoultella ornithinolytica]
MATKKTKPPILPRNYQDPTGADALERRAMKDFARRINKIGKAYKSALDKIPSSLAVNARYEYQLNPTLLSIILSDASYLVDQVLLEGGDYDLWFYEYIDLASEKGTGQSFYNLSQQSPAYAAGRESLASILASDPYQQRMALVHARVFEEMKGLSPEVHLTRAAGYAGKVMIAERLNLEIVQAIIVTVVTPCVAVVGVCPDIDTALTMRI